MVNFNINSIINTNSNSYEVNDYFNPYTFIEFISKTNLDDSEDNFLKYYKEYIEEWTKVKNNNSNIIEAKELIQNQIINLLKIITVSYTSIEEQLFLANLNWDYEKIGDENEKIKAKNAIYSALPIFVKRIKDIAKFYKQKRTEANFVIERNKIKGTQLSIEKIIFDNILNYLFNNDPTKINYAQNYLSISIDNYIDIYTDYFDIDRSTNKTVDYNDIDTSIYFELEEVIKDMLFDGNVFLNEIPLIAQLSIDLSQECVGDKLVLKNELLIDRNLALISDNDKIRLRKKLYEKYIGVDFYYLYKNQDGTHMDVFIKAENPTNNLLNQQTIDTPYTESKQLELLKNIGLFFKPDYTSLLRVNTTNFTYSIDEDKIQDDKIYIFPDPAIYGNVGFNRQVDYPLIIEYSLSEYSKNYSMGWATSDPKVSTAEQPIFGYYTKNQDIDKINKNHFIDFDFTKLYNEGYITKFKSDLYGNKFAIFKEQNGKFARDWDITLFDSKSIDTNNDVFLAIDGGDFINEDTDISADKIEWMADNHYYDFFFEGGLSTLVPSYFRAYIPNNASMGNGDLKLNILDITNQSIISIVNGGEFDIDYNDYEPYSASQDNPIILYSNDIFTSQIEEEKPDYSTLKNKSYYDIRDLKGNIFIYLPSLQKNLEIKDIFPWWQTSPLKDRYNYYIENAINIDIIENVLLITAKAADSDVTSILFEKLEYNPNTNTFIQINDDIEEISFNNKSFESIDNSIFVGNTNISDKASNIFYIEKLHKIYIAIMETSIVPNTDNNIKSVYPIYYPSVYEIDLGTLNIKKYSLSATDAQVKESFRIPDSLYNNNNLLIQKADAPCLTYSSDVNMFMLTYIVYDINMSPYIYKHFFKLNIDGVKSNGSIDIVSLDSTVYNNNYTNESDIITPGNNQFLNIHFDTNIIVS